jgi:hypothetical protein
MKNEIYQYIISYNDLCYEVIDSFFKYFDVHSVRDFLLKKPLKKGFFEHNQMMATYWVHGGEIQFTIGKVIIEYINVPPPSFKYFNFTSYSIYVFIKTLHENTLFTEKYVDDKIIELESLGMIKKNIPLNFNVDMNYYGIYTLVSASCNQS